VGYPGGRSWRGGDVSTRHIRRLPATPSQVRVDDPTDATVSAFSRATHKLGNWCSGAMDSGASRAQQGWPRDAVWVGTAWPASGPECVCVPSLLCCGGGRAR